MVRLSRLQLGGGLATAGLCTSASYALQRLWARWAGEVHWADVIAQEHAPFSWRVGVAVFHGTVLGLMVALAISDEGALRLLDRVPWLVAATMLPLGAAMWALP